MWSTLQCIYHCRQPFLVYQSWSTEMCWLASLETVISCRRCLDRVINFAVYLSVSSHSFSIPILEYWDVLFIKYRDSDLLLSVSWQGVQLCSVSISVFNSFNIPILEYWDVLVSKYRDSDFLSTVSWILINFAVYLSVSSHSFSITILEYWDVLVRKSRDSDFLLSVSWQGDQLCSVSISLVTLF